MYRDIYIWEHKGNHKNSEYVYIYIYIYVFIYMCVFNLLKVKDF